MKVFILTTVMAPYRVQLFSEIGKHCELYVSFEQMQSSGRHTNWYDESAANFRVLKLKKWNASLKTVKLDVIKHIQDINPDVVISYEYHTNTALLMMSYCLLKRIPYIINCDGAFLSKSIKDIVKKFYISKARGFISSGKMAEKYLLHYGADSSCIHFNHFTSLHEQDILKEVPSEEDKLLAKKEKGITEHQVILSVGQFVHRKGLDILLKSAQDLSNNVGVYIIGGKATSEYERIVQTLNLKNIHFIDFMTPEELRGYFLAADVFVHPTREDVWGLVINEAMAYALPVVTTERCVAGLEIIEDGINGYVVPVENHDLLSSAIDKILSDSHLKNSMAVNNLNRIKDYTYESSSQDVMGAIEYVYESAC